MHPSIKNLLLFISLFSLNGCAKLTKHTETIRPTAKVTGTHLANINFDQTDLIFDLAVENNNPASLNLVSLDLAAVSDFFFYLSSAEKSFASV